MNYKTYNRGGQRRTIELPCGFRIVGHPREVDGKIKIHRRRCPICIEISKEKGGFTEAPKFSRVAGDINGWDGNQRSGQHTKKRVTTILGDGFRQDVFTTGNTLDEAIAITKEYAFTEEDRHTFNEIIKLERRWGVEIPKLASNKYSGCELGALPKEKLLIIFNVMNQQIKQREEEIIMSCIDCSVTKAMALETIKILYTHLYEDVENNWDEYYKKYLESKNYNDTK